MVTFDSKSKILTLQVKYVHPNQDVSFAQVATIYLGELPEPMLQFTVCLAKRVVAFALTGKEINTKRTTKDKDGIIVTMNPPWSDVGESLKRAVKMMNPDKDA